MTKLWSTLLAAGSLVATTAACPGQLTADEVTNVDWMKWSKMIQAMGQQKTATESMMKTYLEIRRAVTAEGAKADAGTSLKNTLLGEVNTFTLQLGQLLDGTGEFTKPPSDVICDGLLKVQNKWDDYKTLLQPAYGAELIAYDDYVVGNLTEALDSLMMELKPVDQMYVSLAETYAPAAPGKTIQLAQEQSLLTQKMSKETMLIHFDYEKKDYLEALHQSVNLFDTNHQGLLKGMNSMGLDPLAKRCTLWEMRTVSDVWLHMKPSVQKVLDTEKTDATILGVVATKNVELLTAMNTAADLYMKDDNTYCTDIEKNLNFDEWANGINEAGRGQMFSQKSARLILQIAQPNPANLKVDQDELVDTLAIGLWTLNTLIEGSVQLKVPALPTQELVVDFVAARETWKKFSSTLTANMLILPISSEIIDRVAYLRETYFNQMADTVDAYVKTATREAPTVHSEVIFIAGRQRSLQCKLASEALLIDLGCNVEHHRKLAAESIALWQVVHWRLLNGEKAEDGTVKIKRTENICILRQMLTVIDSFSRINGITGILMESSKDTSSKQDLQSFHEIINAGYGIMNAAVEMYIAGDAKCTLEPLSEEWDMGFGELGRLRSGIERATKEFLFTMRKMNTTDGDINLRTTMEELEETMHKLTYGNTAEMITTPPCQPASDKLFAIRDAYLDFKANLEMAESREADGVLEAVTTQSDALVGHIQELMELYIEDAWQKDKSVEAAMLNATSSLSMALERAQKQVAYSMHQGCAICMEQFGKLKHTIELFDNTYSMLVNGNEEDEDAARRLMAHGAAADAAPEVQHNGTKRTIKAINQGILFSQLRAINDKWRQMKPKLEKIIKEYEEDEDFPSTTQIVEQADFAKAVATASDTMLYSASTRTTTSVPLHVLTPLPLSGEWTGGKTMRTAARFAETIINEQQVVMPGFAINNVFFDDKCNSDEGMRLVLKESASATTDYVALGGAGCTHVCASAAFAAASMNMPFLSYECSGRELSSTTEYPGFTRMGTPLSRSMDFIIPMAEHFEWANIAVVTGDPGKYRGVADYYEEQLNNAGIPNSYYASFDYTIAETVNMAKQLVADNRRVILLGGDEQLMRRVICGTMVAGAPLGILWIYEGVFSEKWWTIEDAALVEEQPMCTAVAITQSFRSAVNLAGMGKALPHEEELELECFKGYTSKSFLEAVHTHLADGYPMPGDNETMIERPHVGLSAHAADGVCALMKALAFMRAEGNTVEQLRNPTPEFYQEFLSYLKSDLVFQGVSGWVNFTGNDKPETISLKQVRGDTLVEVGMAFPNGSMILDMEAGLVNNTWVTEMSAAGHAYPMFIFQLLALVVCSWSQ